MKRQREDPSSYLGGDLADLQTVMTLEDDISGETRELTKAERNRLRKHNNKKWKLMDRKVGSGKDPSPRHTLYYQAQIPALRDEDEWRAFQSSLVTPLPVSFRIGGNCSAIVEHTFRKRMHEEFNRFAGHFVEVNGQVLREDIVKSVPWASRAGTGAETTVWQVAADSATLAKNPGFEVLSTLLRREVALGNIVRQELASMIPALLLNVEGHHNILDVCSAPGSKTEQLLQLMRTGDRKSSGMVVANDADPVRINTLKNRYSRCLTPNLVITCATAEELSSRINEPVFDRVLADVPCSGDGTMRKFPHIWRLFRPRMSLDLHNVQLSIAKASVDLLKAGGRMVYSTCSINPLEDEAVVCALLKHYWSRGLRLVDTRAEGLLPGLKTREGLSHWRCDPDVFVIGEAEDTRKESLSRLPELVTTMFPPSEEEAKYLHLEFCHRVLPHDNDTGGFFVAVLELREVDDISPTDLNYFATNNIKKKKTIKESKVSVDVMKELGYNPKRKNTLQGSSKNNSKKERNNNNNNNARKNNKKDAQRKEQFSDPEDLLAYENISASELKHISRALGVYDSASNGALLRDPASNSSQRIHVMTAVNNNQRASEQEVASLVSFNVKEAVETWARDDASPNSNGQLLISAGVPVAVFTRSHPQECGIVPDGITSLLPWLDAPSTCCHLTATDFRALARLRCDAGDISLENIPLLSKNEGFLKNMILYVEDEMDSEVFPNVSKEGHSVLDGLYRSCLYQLESDESLETIHFVVLLDPLYVPGLQQSEALRSELGRGLTLPEQGDRKKRRLSKVERKRLGKQKEVYVSLTSSSATGGADKQNKIIPSPSVVTTPAQEEEANTSEATLVFQIKKCDDNGGLFDFLFSFLTKEDVCKSYVASIL